MSFSLLRQVKPAIFKKKNIFGGSGITPIYQLIRGILNNLEDKIAITLIYGANRDEELLLKEDFEQFEKTFPGRFKVAYTGSHPVEGSAFHRGYVDRELLEEVALPLKNTETKVIVCGPPAMENSLIGKGGVPGIL
ncbi:hypothetical protein QQX98_001486 [Neonectria punicea]|uniref:Oxidoreductase FAD/NAD(P)-binding domain-containing protein n=1 Tax=Neonectria punicea TaxID=979145 RepID=A0ABR1HN81_9HYPO